MRASLVSQYSMSSCGPVLDVVLGQNQVGRKSCNPIAILIDNHEPTRLALGEAMSPVWPPPLSIRLRCGSSGELRDFVELYRVGPRDLPRILLVNPPLLAVALKGHGKMSLRRFDPGQAR
jgi:hypothetical protein